MAKITRLNVFRAISLALKNNDEKTANIFFTIVSKSISPSRKDNDISDYIELTQKQRKYFKGEYEQYIIDDEST